VRDPGRADAVVEVYRERTDRVSQQVDQVAFDREGRTLRTLLIADKSLTFRLQSFAAAWHWVEWGGPVVRWFYFLAGLMGAGVAAAGLVVFAAKRRARSGQARWFRVAEAVNVAAVAGACVACLAFLWAERLIPAEAPGRVAGAAWAFFLAWAASLAHAAVRPPRRAWAEQLGLTAALCLALPWVDGLAFRHLAEADWVRIDVDATLLAFGALFAAVAWKVHAAAPKPRAAPVLGEA
jgi:hypothetical protein